MGKIFTQASGGQGREPAASAAGSGRRPHMRIPAHRWEAAGGPSGAPQKGSSQKRPSLREGFDPPSRLGLVDFSATCFLASIFQPSTPLVLSTRDFRGFDPQLFPSQGDAFEGRGAPPGCTTFASRYHDMIATTGAACAAPQTPNRGWLLWGGGAGFRGCSTGPPDHWWRAREPDRSRCDTFATGGCPCQHLTTPSHKRRTLTIPPSMPPSETWHSSDQAEFRQSSRW